jgi:hypothetical protein
MDPDFSSEMSRSLASRPDGCWKTELQKHHFHEHGNFNPIILKDIKKNTSWKYSDAAEIQMCSPFPSHGQSLVKFALIPFETSESLQFQTHKDI